MVELSDGSAASPMGASSVYASRPLTTRRAAGGATRLTDGGAFVYGKRGQADDVDFANPWFVAVGDAALLGSIDGG